MTTDALGDVLARIEHRLESLEKKLHEKMTPPEAVKIEEAARLLSCSGTTIKREIRKGRIRPVRIGGRDHIPMSEIFRLTSVTSAPTSAPSPSRPRSPRTRKQQAKTTKESIRDLLKKF